MPEASRGLLLVDVDGPLNPYAAKPTARPPGYETFRYTADGDWLTGRRVRRYKGIRVWLHPGHGALLRALADETGLELVWSTTWMHEANTKIGPAIGLDPLPVIEFPEADYRRESGWLRGGNWKWPAVAEYAAGRPLAWLDDEHGNPRFEDARAAFDRERAGDRTLLCHVDPRHGLQDEHLTRIRAWAAEGQLGLGMSK